MSRAGDYDNGGGGTGVPPTPPGSKDPGGSVPPTPPGSKDPGTTTPPAPTGTKEAGTPPPPPPGAGTGGGTTVPPSPTNTKEGGTAPTGGTGGGAGGAPVGGTSGNVQKGTPPTVSPTPPANPADARPGSAEATLSTAASWFQKLHEDNQTEIGGDSRTLVQGNTEEYINGTKTCYVYGFVEEFYLGTKNGAVYGLETKIVVGALAEAFLAAKLVMVVALCFEHNEASKYHLTPGTDKLVTNENKLNEDVKKETIARLEETAAKAEFRCPTAIEKITNYVQKIDKLSATVSAAVNTLDTFKGKYGDVKVKGTNCAKKISGSFNSKAADLNLKSDGRILLKGSEVKLKGGSSTIHCAGSVTLNKHLKIG